MFGPNSTKMTFVVILGVLLIVVLGVIVIILQGRDTTMPTTPTPPYSTSTTPTAIIASTTVLVFGDSITAGYGISLTDAYPSQLERMLRNRGYSVQVLNSGVTGETTAGGLRRAPFAAAQKADIIVLALGGNDVLRGILPASTKKNLEGMIEIFEATGARVILVGMRAPSNLGDTYVKEFDALYSDLAATYQIPLVPFLLEGVALDPTLNQNDGIHPNTEGARIIAEKNILPALLPLLLVR